MKATKKQNETLENKAKELRRLILSWSKGEALFVRRSTYVALMNLEDDMRAWVE